MANTPEESEHTSVKHRLALLNQGTVTTQSLEAFVGVKNETIGIPFKLNDYLKLVDWTGRIIRDDKRGHIDNDLPDILNRLSLNTEAWKILTTEFETRFQCWVGSEHIVRRVCEDKGYQRAPPPTTAHHALFG